MFLKMVTDTKVNLKTTIILEKEFLYLRHTITKENLRTVK